MTLFAKDGGNVIPNNRRHGFSLKEALLRQGVSQEGLETHIPFLYETICINPRLDLERYRVHPHNPDTVMMG